MAYLLGALVVWVPLLALAGTVTWFCFALVREWEQRAQRRRRAAWWAANPYERGAARALDAIADRNGYAATLDEYGQLER